MWIVTDKWGNEIRLTDERWEHIIHHHWELEDYLDEILEAVRIGRRKQSADISSKYKYSKAFDDLPHDYTNIVVVVKLEPDNFIITAYPIRRGRRRR